MAQEQGPEGVFQREVQEWELEMIKKVAQAFRTDDRADLEAELARKLLMLKENRPSHIRNWKAYLAKFLYNKAANWVRDRRARERKRIQPSWPGETGDELDVLGDRALFTASERDLSIAFREAWDELDDDLRRFWQVLAEEKGNQARTARRIGKHRNTVRLWIRKIKETLDRHGGR